VGDEHAHTLAISNAIFSVSSSSLEENDSTGDTLSFSMQFTIESLLPITTKILLLLLLVAVERRRDAGIEVDRNETFVTLKLFARDVDTFVIAFSSLSLQKIITFGVVVVVVMMLLLWNEGQEVVPHRVW